MAVDAARAKSLFLTASDLTDPAARAAYLESASAAVTPNSVPWSRHCSPPTAARNPSGMRTSPPARTDLTRNPGGDRGLPAEKRLPSELATAEDRSDGADFTLARTRRLIAPADQAWARSSPAGTRCSKSSARGEWAPFTGPVRLNRSSGRWR